MIEYTDGSVLAQISATDMRMPIQYALTYPDRCEAPVPKIDWRQAANGSSCRRISTSFRSALAYQCWKPAVRLPVR